MYSTDYLYHGQNCDPQTKGILLWCPQYPTS